MSDATANYVLAEDALDAWRSHILSGTPPTFYPVGTGELQRMEIGPGLVTLVGGCPGAGKTAFSMQIAVDALRLTPTLRVLVCNIEMPAAVLLDRQLSRLSGIDLRSVRYREFGPEHADRLDQALQAMAGFAGRLGLVRPPFDLDNVAAAADDMQADVIVLDYIQRIAPAGSYGDRRSAVDATMNFIRQFTDAGVAVIVVSSVSRSKDSKGRSSYEAGSLNLASFRESSELEFGADDAFILAPESSGDIVTLMHLKSRHGETCDIRLRFLAAYQRFEPVEATTINPGRKTHAEFQRWQS